MRSLYDKSPRGQRAMTHHSRSDEMRGQLSRRPNIPAHPAVPDLICLTLPTLDSVLEVEPAKTLIIGRRPRPEDPPVAIDLEIFDAQQFGVSRCHAMIAVVQGGLYVQDLHSMNGSMLNGRRLDPLQRYPLLSGDTLTLGRLPMEVTFVHLVRSG